MTSPDVIRQRLELVESIVLEQCRLARPDLLDADVRERRFVEHSLQLAIQAAIDAASHVVASERLGTPRSAFHAFELLAQAGWLEREQLDVLGQIVGFRNVLVHGYAEVDLRIVHDVLEYRLDDLLHFAATLRRKLAN